MIGDVIGRLTVVSQALERDNGGGRKFWCECICGEFIVVRIDHLKTGAIKSCSCFQRESVKTNSFKHGRINTAEYRSYTHAKTRCTNPRTINYQNYGGRGIKFLFTSFEEFYKELGPRPKWTTLDRKDNSGNYEKGNVRWATDVQQQNNRRARSQ